jgi:peroxiredoxin
MLALGTAAPDFRLPATNGRMVSLADFQQSPALLVAFMCNHCPYVKLISGALAELGRECRAKDVGMVGINSNDAENYPADSPTKMEEVVDALGYVFPYVFDETQAVAKAYRAACTPDFFLFDTQQKLVYRGQFDDSRPGNGLAVTGRDLRAALEAVLAGKPVSIAQKPSTGCNIKWKPGNEPDYF